MARGGGTGLTEAIEDYLKAVYKLGGGGGAAVSRIARSLKVSAPSVTNMVQKMRGLGLVAHAPYGAVRLTPRGRKIALEIIRHHRLWETYLTRRLGLPLHRVHEEAERLEHAMSPVLEERMLAAIGDAKTCPHGHPLVEGVREEGALLADVESGATVHVLRFENEAEEILHYLKAAGLHPGLDGTLETSGPDEVVLSSEDGEHAVSRSVAETVSVRASPSPAPRPPLPEQLVLSSDRYGR